MKEHEKTHFLNLTFVHKNGVERKIEEGEVLWTKIDTNNPTAKQVKKYSNTFNIIYSMSVVMLFSGGPKSGIQLSRNGIF